MYPTLSGPSWYAFAAIVGVGIGGVTVLATMVRVVVKLDSAVRPPWRRGGREGQARASHRTCPPQFRSIVPRLGRGGGKAGVRRGVMSFTPAQTDLLQPEINLQSSEV